MVDYAFVGKMFDEPKYAENSPAAVAMLLVLAQGEMELILKDIHLSPSALNIAGIPELVENLERHIKMVDTVMGRIEKASAGAGGVLPATALPGHKELIF